MSMLIEPGQFLVVHYDSPTHKNTLNKDNDKREKTVATPEADDKDEIEKGNDFVEFSSTGSEDAVNTRQSRKPFSCTQQ